MSRATLHDQKKKNFTFRITDTCQKILTDLTQEHNLPSLSECVEQLARGTIIPVECTQGISIPCVIDSRYLPPQTNTSIGSYKIIYFEPKKTVGYGITPSSKRVYDYLTIEYGLGTVSNTLELVARGIIRVNDQKTETLDAQSQIFRKTNDICAPLISSIIGKLQKSKLISTDKNDEDYLREKILEVIDVVVDEHLNK